MWALGLVWEERGSWMRIHRLCSMYIEDVFGVYFQGVKGHDMKNSEHLNTKATLLVMYYIIVSIWEYNLHNLLFSRIRQPQTQPLQCRVECETVTMCQCDELALSCTLFLQEHSHLQGLDWPSESDYQNSDLRTTVVLIRRMMAVRRSRKCGVLGRRGSCLSLRFLSSCFYNLIQQVVNCSKICPTSYS